jgi:hypothetical protein
LSSSFKKFKKKYIYVNDLDFFAPKQGEKTRVFSLHFSNAMEFDMYDSVLPEPELDAAIQEKTQELDTLAQEIKVAEEQIKESPKKTLLQKYVENHPESKPDTPKHAFQNTENTKQEPTQNFEEVPKRDIRKNPEQEKQEKQQEIESKTLEILKRPIRRIGFTSEPPNDSSAKRPRLSDNHHKSYQNRPKFNDHNKPLREFSTRASHSTDRTSHKNASHKNRILLVSCDNAKLEKNVMQFLKEKKFPVYSSSNRFKVATSHILDGKENEEFTKFIEEQTLKYFDKKFIVFHFGEWLERNKLTKAFVFGIKNESAERLKSKYNVMDVAFGEMGSIRPKCDSFIEFDSRNVQSQVQEVFDGYR